MEFVGIVLVCLIKNYIQEMDIVMETDVQDTHIFINAQLGHHFPVIWHVSLLE
jgi:hypothetical protein